jgi:hypothetical protein
MMTAAAAFAQPAAAAVRYNGHTEVRKEVVVVKHHKRLRSHRAVRTVRYERNHR